MNPTDAILREFQLHWQAIAGAVSVLCIAAASQMPVKIPLSAQELWTWARDTFQTAIPAARHPYPSTPPPTPVPLDPQKESK